MSYVTYVEFNVSDLPKVTEFYREAFQWNPEPWGGPEYLVAQHGDKPGIDTGITVSQDGQPRTVAVINVANLEAAMAKVTECGGTIVVEKFTIPYVGYGAYFTDPGGMIVGLHQADAEAR